jgi:uncharacterized protein YaeQ
MYRFSIDISDLDRGVYENKSAHVALHPSETLERMVVRLLAYCINYHERLEFTKGLSSDNEPDLWQKSLSDEIELWVEVGLPDAKRMKKAHNQSRRTRVYAYGGQGVENWWSTVSKQVTQSDRLEVFQVPLAPVEEFAQKIERTMRMSVMIQDGIVNLSWDGGMLELSLQELGA